MTEQDKKEFNAYLANCTDSQVREVYNKELSGYRKEYAELAYSELCKRGLAATHN